MLLVQSHVRNAPIRRRFPLEISSFSLRRPLAIGKIASVFPFTIAPSNTQPLRNHLTARRAYSVPSVVSSCQHTAHTVYVSQTLSSWLATLFAAVATLLCLSCYAGLKVTSCFRNPRSPQVNPEGQPTIYRFSKSNSAFTRGPLAASASPLADIHTCLVYLNTHKNIAICSQQVRSEGVYAHARGGPRPDFRRRGTFALTNASRKQAETA